MSDHVEEQEMEAEALTAIFDTAFEVTSSEQPFKWTVSLYPVDTQDDAERDELNHVGCRLNVELPVDYPDVLPSIDIEVIKVCTSVLKQIILHKHLLTSLLIITVTPSLFTLSQGLAEENRTKILEIANEEAEAYMGMPAIYAVCEAIRTWLADNNVKGLDDVSMHAQMMRKQMEAEKSKVGLQNTCYCLACLHIVSSQSRIKIIVKPGRFIHHKHWISLA